MKYRLALIISFFLLLNLNNNSIYGQGSRAYFLRDALYSEYRQGQIKRHIGQNGRYLQYLWLRSRDGVDSGSVNNWQGTETLADVEENRREFDQRFPATSALGNTWYPLVYFETLPKTIPPQYQLNRTIAHIITNPNLVPRRNRSDLIPLYEWERNEVKETSNYRYKDHFYSTDRHSPVARYRYQFRGVIGYIYKSASPGLTAMFAGYDENEKNHKITLNKGNPGNLKNFKQLGYVRAQGPNSTNTIFRPLIEYRNSTGPLANNDNMYSTREGPNTEFLARWSVAGGADNPLYEGGISLATFSLEHIHGVSQYSINYAIKLFEFIEYSEEVDESVLVGNTNPIGILRRRKNFWAPHQKLNGLGWAASNDELLGVMIGLKYFAKATRNSHPQYNARAVALAGRIGTYLANHNWIYADSRVPFSRDEYNSEPMVKDRAMGTFTFQYAYARVLRELTGNSFSGPGTFNSQMDFWLDIPILEGEPFLVKFLHSTLLSCPADIITDYTCLDELDLGCFSWLNNHRELYDLMVRNTGPIWWLKSKCDDSTFTDLFNIEIEQMEFFNHALVLYSGILVLQSDIISNNRKKEVARNFARYIRRMTSPCTGETAYCSGPAGSNLLFAVVGKMCSQLLTSEELGDSFNLSLPPLGSRNSQRKRSAGRRFTEAMDGIINRIASYPNRYTWQPQLPIGEPNRSYCQPSNIYLPWAMEPPYDYFPLGIGKDASWRHQNFEFSQSFQGRNTWSWLKEIGPWYDGNGASDAIKQSGSLIDSCNYNGTRVSIIPSIIDNLKKFARVGYSPGTNEFNQLMVGNRNGIILEAGGNDLMFMRMMLTEIQVLSKPDLLPAADKDFPVLPVDAASPW